jgi:Cu/Ag efflux protein CusF
MFKENQARREELQKEYEELLEEMNEVGAESQSYSKDSVIEIPGPLFSSFINYVSNSKQTLEHLNNTITMFANQVNNAIEISLTDNDAFTVAILREHLKQVKAGKTVSNSTIEKENSEENVKEVKSDK